MKRHDNDNLYSSHGRCNISYKNDSLYAFQAQNKIEIFAKCSLLYSVCRAKRHDLPRNISFNRQHSNINRRNSCCNYPRIFQASSDCCCSLRLHSGTFSRFYNLKNYRRKLNAFGGFYMQLYKRNGMVVIRIPYTRRIASGANFNFVIINLKLASRSVCYAASDGHIHITGKIYAME